MFLDSTHNLSQLQGDARAVDVSIIMPCLDEAISLPHCIANARRALDRIEADYGLFGEIVIADNGSTDGSQQIATDLGARVVPVAARGYGAALIGGCEGAWGRYLMMGDADGSYDFTDGVAMIGELLAGADLCMGSRFRGGIAPGAMPWKNRYIGNPLLTGILNLFFRSGISDAHCGLRAITRDCFASLGLSGSGMEFASEMVIKASLRRFRITEVPATLSVDLRDRAPHLRPWRDGWRHLRYLLMLSPTWVFGVPAALAMGLSALVLAVAIGFWLKIFHGETPFGVSWSIASGFLFTTGHLALLMAVAGHLHGVTSGYRRLRPMVGRMGRLFNLETMLAIGALEMLSSAAIFAITGWYWSAHGFVALPNPMPLVLAGVLGATGAQTVFGGFLLAIMAGHDARFVGNRQPVRLPGA
ncbi:glycosyltransferase involved in cell wall biosynthesis [Sphingobium sp. OAS761]|uniref:glycosyltransferase family 2 protein n=1 Tax=Sphingobium sp. OAS761 TaxID=2817901 RepID=UPI00209D7EB7|nr:glycosyltransferase family 2 protein [Sphingobium sp. OAS761]MCP1470867.1 glycosyltransferase involved in cell wall biosynthesis [Sphingobium sp. OAS761]